MPLIPLRPLLETTVKYGFAQGAFNVNAVAQAKAVIQVHEMFRSAAILQGADLANGFMGGRVDFANATLEDKKIGAKNIANAVKKYGATSDIPVVLHLDHGKNFDSCKAAIPCGINKINVDTDIRLAVTRNMKEFFAKYPDKQTSASIGGIYELLESKKDQFDPRAFLEPIMDTVMYGNIPDEDVAAIVACIEAGVKEAVGTLIVQFGSYGKAPLVEQVSLDEMICRYKAMEK